MSDPKLIPPHVSPVRWMWAEAHDEPYRAYTSLAEARTDPAAALIMEADSGGQIMVTCPVSRVHADEAVVNQLLCDLEMICWGPGGLAKLDKPYDAWVYYEHRPPGSGVGGGMGGGAVIDGVWIHDELEGLGLRPQIEQIFAGTRRRLEKEDGVRFTRR